MGSSSKARPARVLSTRPKPRVWHAISKNEAHTFLTYDEMWEFLSSRSIEDVDKNWVIAESEITGDEYDRLSRWAGAIS